MTCRCDIPPREPELVRVAIVARHRKYLYPLSLRQVERMCRDGVFKSATKLGSGDKAHWFVSSAEIMAYKMSRHSTQIDNS